MSTAHKSTKNYDYQFKIIIIGDAGVGKTALLQRVHQKPFRAEYSVTIGVDLEIVRILVDSKRCELEIWDTAGSERFKSVRPSYYRRAQGIIICFDITDMKSFREVEAWLRESKRFCNENTPVFLVGTKADKKSERVVTNQAIHAFCFENNLSYIETSAKANENVEECFTTFARILIARSDQTQIDDASRKTDSPIIDPILDRKPIPDESAHGCKIKEKCAF